MGEYTGVRCKVIIEPEYRGFMQSLADNDYNWNDSHLGLFKEYAKDSRANFIPRGEIAEYMPDEWKNDETSLNPKFNTIFNKETGYWQFQCSLKDYDNTIKNFFENVLSVITERIIHLETYYNGIPYSDSYKLENGKIILDNPKFIQYEDDCDDNWYYGGLNMIIKH